MEKKYKFSIKRSIIINIDNSIKYIAFLVGFVENTSFFEVIKCSSTNKKYSILLEDLIEENIYQDHLIDLSNLCISCSRFLKYCICINNKINKKPLWYFRVSKTNNNDLFHVDLSCIKISLYKHPIHFSFPSFLVKSLACTTASCSEILNPNKIFIIANKILCKSGHINDLF